MFSSEAVGEGNGNPLQYPCLENPVGGGAWWAAVHRVAQSRTWLRRLSMHACIGEGNGNPLQCSCLENPRDRGAWRAAIYGVARSQTRLKRLSSSSEAILSNSWINEYSPPVTRCIHLNYMTSDLVLKTGREDHCYLKKVGNEISKGERSHL